MSTKKPRGRPGHRAKLLRIAERLRAGEDRDRIASELESMARGPGRPKDPPAERGLRRYKRVIFAQAIYEGVLPADLYPASLDLAVRNARNSQTEADAVAAEILGVSLRAIQAARLSNRRPMSSEHFREFLAVLTHSAFRK
jgi:hypothetical protein